MSDDILEEDLYDRLNIYEHSHPNLVNIWKSYLNRKKINYIQSLVDCDIMVRRLTTTDDISFQSIALLSILLENNNLNE